MRVLLLSALAATAFADTNACDADCVTAIYTAVSAASQAANGYQDADMAVYGYTLYTAYVGAANDETAVAAAGGNAAVAGGLGLAYIATFIAQMSAVCAEYEFNAGTRDGMSDCLNAAQQEDVDQFNADNDELAAVEATAGLKAANEAIIGVFANQLAPGSAFAEAFPGLTAAEFKTALEVYYVVGAFYEVFEIIETPGVFADEDAKTACYAAVGTAIEYEEGEDFAEALVTKADEGAAAFADDACFGAEGNAPGGLDVDAFTDAFEVTVDGIGASVTTANGEVARLESTQPTAPAGSADDDEASATSGAAVFSAVAAAVALML